MTMTMPMEREYNNNEILSLIILWGRVYFTNQDPKKEQDKIEAQFNADYGEEKFIPELKRGIKLLQKSVKEAFDVSRSSEIFKLAPENPEILSDEVWLRSWFMGGVATFEDVVCLYEAFLRWENLHRLEGYTNWLKTVEKMHSDIYYPGNLSIWYRLIPINKYQQFRRKAILPVFHNPGMGLPIHTWGTKSVTHCNNHHRTYRAVYARGVLSCI